MRQKSEASGREAWLAIQRRPAQTSHVLLAQAQPLSRMITFAASETQQIARAARCVVLASLALAGVCDVAVGDAPTCPYEPPPDDAVGTSLAGGMKVPPQAASERLSEAASESLPPMVDQLLRGLAALSSIHLKARVVAQTIAGEGRPAATDLTEYEYWESGRRYRIHAYLNPTMGLGEIPEVAFDGTHHQMVLQAGLERTLSITGQDVRMVPIGIPNPLSLSLAFLSPDDQDRCPLCELRLADLVPLAAKRSAKPGKSGAPMIAGSLSVRGGCIYDAGSRFELSLDGAGRVATIRQLTESGREINVVALSDYRRVGATTIELPRVIDFQRSDPQAKAPWLVVRYIVDRMEVNQPLDDSAFVISRDTVSKVWDSDAASWRKYSGFDTAGFCKKP